MLCFPVVSLYLHPILMLSLMLSFLNIQYLSLGWVGGFRKNNPSYCFFPNNLPPFRHQIMVIQTSLVSNKYIKRYICFSQSFCGNVYFHLANTRGLSGGHFMSSWAELNEPRVVFSSPPQILGVPRLPSSYF